MTDSTKALIGGFIGAITIIGSLLVMANCSVKVARVNGERAAECVTSNGQWHSLAEGQVADQSYCDRTPRK